MPHGVKHGVKIDGVICPCDLCRAARNERQKERRNKRVASGKCVDGCDAAPLPGYVRCGPCLDDHNARYRSATSTPSSTKKRAAAERRLTEKKSAGV